MGNTLQVHRFPFGTMSGLIGGEHYLPLARYALYAGGTQLYIAAATEHGEPWLSTLRHIAKEGRVFVLGCGMLLGKEDLLENSSCKRFAAPIEGTWIHSGDSAILYTEIDPQEMYGSKWMLDVAGHDARPDIFQLTVHRELRSLIRTKKAESAQDGETVP